jgi:putative Ca2+/H+ antiporter (TMEM165/GDT1 family)
VLPHRGVEAMVAFLSLAGAVYAWREGTKDEEQLEDREASRHGVVITAFVVIFLAEWGDLTQILTAHYHSPSSVAGGSVLALWAVAALAVADCTTLLRFVNVSTVRKITAGALVALALYTGRAAIS